MVWLAGGRPPLGPEARRGPARATQRAGARLLVRGRSLAPADGAQQADGIVRYRTGKVIELRKEKVEN